jgi:hypothetical protein
MATEPIICAGSKISKSKSGWWWIVEFEFVFCVIWCGGRGSLLMCVAVVGV